MVPTNKKRLWDNNQDSDSDAENKHSYNSCNNWPRFLVVESSSDDLLLSKLSPFAVQKGFQAVAETLKSIKRLRDGSFLVDCGKRAQAQNLLRTNRFIDRPVRVSIHKTLNSFQGVIRCRDLTDMSEFELKDELKDQDVVGVNWVTLKKEGKMIPTNTLFLTFRSPELPKEITVGYLKVKVALFVSNPVCCFNCNKFGHTSQRCKVAAKCTVVEKISMKVNVRDPSCALIAMVPMLHQLKIAWSGRRRRRFNVSALKNAYPFQKPDSWLKPRCQLWSLEERPTPLPLPPEENPNLFSVRPH